MLELAKKNSNPEFVIMDNGEIHMTWNYLRQKTRYLTEDELNFGDELFSDALDLHTMDYYVGIIREKQLLSENA